MPYCKLPRPERCQVCKEKPATQHVAWCIEADHPEWCFWACDECTSKYLRRQAEIGCRIPYVVDWDWWKWNEDRERLEG